MAKPRRVSAPLVTSAPTLRYQETQNVPGFPRPRGEETASHAEELKNILRMSLQKLETSLDSPHAATLEELIAVSITRMGFS